MVSDGTAPFTRQVWLDSPSLPSETENRRIKFVFFEPNLRSHWQSDRDGQTLYLVAGKGPVVIGKGKPISIRPRTESKAGANRDHWHGATAESFMSRAS